MVHVMSEVKRDVCHACVSLPREVHCLVCDPEIGCRKELDAQRLRADTAEADLLRTSDALLAAEQRIAVLEDLLRQAKEYGGLTPKWHNAVDAALNPNLEAESHEPRN